MKPGAYGFLLFYFPFYKSIDLERLKRCKQTILPMYCIIKKKKKKKKIIKNQFELNSEKCIKMRMSGPEIHIELSVISR